MAKKLYDLTVKTGEYQSQGETKSRYQTIGSMLESDDGKPFLMLSRWFNPAGVPSKEGSDSILVSCFEPRERDKPKGGRGKDDDTPF